MLFDQIQLCKTDNFALRCSASYQQYIHLILSIKNSVTNTFHVFQATIESENQVAKSFGSLKQLCQYLEEVKNIKITQIQNFAQVILISKTEVKGKQKQIQIGRITMNFKQVVHSQQKNSSNKLEQIILSCKSSNQLSDVTIKSFFIALASSIINLQSQSSKNMQEMIDPLINKIMLLGNEQDLLKDKLSGCIQEIKGVQNQISLTVESIREKLKENQQYLSNIRKVNEQNFENSNKLCKKVQKNVQIGIQQLKATWMKVNLYQLQELQQTNLQIEIIKKSLNINRRNHQIQPNKLMNQMILRPTYSYSAVLKHRSIKLLSANSIQGTDSTRSKIALVSPSLGQSRESSTKFRILKDSFDVLIGLCDLDKVNKLGFAVESWGSGNHGGYYVNSGGYLYSCYKKQDNDVLKSFTFKDQDVIQVTFSQDKKSITFRKGQETCILQYDPNTKAEKLHFCTVLHKNSSIVQIII